MTQRGPGSPGARLAGRDLEVARVDAFVAASLGRAGAHGLVVRGEAGIGKTTLWRAALDCSRAAGLHVLVSRPAEEELQSSMVVLRDLFEDLDVDAGPALLDPDTDLFDRGRAVLRALRLVTDERPVVLAIDDLQWVDPISARSLRYALRRLDDRPVGLLGTQRTDIDEPDSSALLPRERLEYLALAPLDTEAIREVIAPIVTGIPRPSLEQIQQHSGGNPMYAIELARSTDPAASRLAGVGHHSLRGILSARLEKTPPDVLAVLRTAAALGPATIERLEVACGGPPPGQSIAAAIGLGLLTVDDAFVIRFTHPLLTSVVLGALAPAERRAVHARLAGIVTEPDDRARHLALSTVEPDADVASELDAAAARIGRRGAPGLAAELVTHARRITPVDDSEAGERRVMAEIAHRAAAGETARALAIVDDALARLPAGRRRIDVLSRRVYLDTARSAAFLDSALADAGDDELQRARVLNIQAWIAGINGGRLADAIRLSEQVLDTARRHRDEDLQMLAAVTLSTSALLAGRPRSEVLDTAMAFAERRGGPRLGAWPQVYRGRHCLWGGQLSEARSRFDELRAVFARAGTEFQRPYRLYDLALVELAAGNVRLAAELVDDGVEAATDAHNEQARAWLAYPEGLIHAHLGSPGRATEAAARLHAWGRDCDEPPRVVSAHHVRGLVALAEGSLAEAASEFGAGVELAGRIDYRHPGAIPILPDAIEAATAAGMAEWAGELAAELGAQAAALRLPWPDAAARRGKGLAATVAGDAAAPHLLADAAAAFDAMGYRLDAARTWWWHARALQRTGRRAPAGDVLAETGERFESMGTRPWADLAAADLERVAPGRASGSLTQTEARIAELVAEGCRNREVAATLFVSVATVEAHLTRIYRKLGVRSRTELSRMVQNMNVGA